MGVLSGLCCVQIGASGATHHYRKSKLTMALKHGFETPAAITVILATVSPASKDTEHSLNTLRHACIMKPDGAVMDERGDPSSCAGVRVQEIDRINVAVTPHPPPPPPSKHTQTPPFQPRVFLNGSQGKKRTL